MGIPVNSVPKSVQKPSSDSIQNCSICNREVGKNPRYPKYVCYKCQDESPPVNEDGISIEFGNIDASGGFRSVVNGVRGAEHICYIKGIRCYADEGRFGGIMIQPTK